MKINEYKKCIDYICEASALLKEIEKYVGNAEKTVSNETISLYDSNMVYSLDYKPAIEPIKKLYNEYIRSFNYVIDFFRSAIKNLMSVITIEILSLDNSRVSDNLRIADKTYSNCNKAKIYAEKIFKAMSEILKITINGISEKGQLPKKPTEIESFAVANASTLDLYDPNTGIHSEFENLNRCLNVLNDKLNSLVEVVSSLSAIKEGCSLETILISFERLSDKLDLMVNEKKGEENKISDILKKANALMLELQSKIKIEMEKRRVPISAAFSRIVPTVPTEEKYGAVSIKRVDDRLISTGIPDAELSEILKHRAMATITVSTVCSIQKDGKDCKGQLNLSVLKEMHIVSSDAEELFIVDDGYSVDQLLSEYQRIDANDFNKGDKIYCSRNAWDKLQAVLKSC